MGLGIKSLSALPNGPPRKQLHQSRQNSQRAQLEVSPRHQSQGRRRLCCVYSLKSLDQLTPM